jgi:hypothetical protein
MTMAPASSAQSRRIWVTDRSSGMMAVPGVKAAKDRAFFAGDALDGAEGLEMGGGDGGDHRDMRAGQRASGSISPGWFMPISMMAKSVSAGIRASVSGTPQWLL